MFSKSGNYTSPLSLTISNNYTMPILFSKSIGLPMIPGLTFTGYNGDAMNDTVPSSSTFVNWFNTRQLSDISITGITTSLASIDNGTNGYYNTNSEQNQFSVQWIGYYTPIVSGIYNFFCGSDDGSLLRLDDSDIINNIFYQGYPGENPDGSSYLTGGHVYAVAIYFNQGFGGYDIRVTVTPPGGSETDFASLCTTNSSISTVKPIINSITDKTYTGIGPFIFSVSISNYVTVGSVIWSYTPPISGLTLNSSTGEFTATNTISTTQITVIATASLSNTSLPVSFNLTVTIISISSLSLFAQLSTGAVSSAISAFSLRSIKYNTALVVQVYKVVGSSSVTQDFWADISGNLTTAQNGGGQTLESWLGGATGYVRTWYDQSGAGNHATQPNTMYQPIIQRATKGPGYMILFTGSQYLIGFTSDKLNNTNYTVCMNERRTAAYGNGTSDNPILSCGLGSVDNRYLHNTYRSNTMYWNGVYGSQDFLGTISAFVTNEPIRYGFTLRSAQSGANIYVYGDPIGNPIKAKDTGKTVLLANMPSDHNLYLGAINYIQPSYPPFLSYYIGEMYEILIFNTSLYDIDGTTGTAVPSDIQAIYTNQSTYING